MDSSIKQQHEETQEYTMASMITDTDLSPRVNLTAMRAGWIESIVEAQPKLFVTVTFPLDVPHVDGISSDKEYHRYFLIPKPKTAIQSVNKFLKHAAQRVLSRNENDVLRGYGCLEFQRSGMPHFHLLLENDVPLAVFEKRAKNLLTTARMHGNPISTLDAESIDVREVHDVRRAARYVTKVLEPHALKGEQMLVINDNRILPEEDL